MKNSVQFALNGAKSTVYYENNQLHILYGFGDFVILENKNTFENKIGTDFDYLNPWENSDGAVENIGYEISEITGIL